MLYVYIIPLAQNDIATSKLLCSQATTLRFSDERVLQRDEVSRKRVCYKQGYPATLDQYAVYK